MPKISEAQENCAKGKYLCSQCLIHGQLNEKKGHVCAYVDCSCVLCLFKRTEIKKSRTIQRKNLKPENSEDDNKSENKGKAKTSVKRAKNSGNPSQSTREQSLKVYMGLVSSNPLNIKNIHEFEREALLRKCNYDPEEAFKQVRHAIADKLLEPERGLELSGNSTLSGPKRKKLKTPVPSSTYVPPKNDKSISPDIIELIPIIKNESSN